MKEINLGHILIENRHKRGITQDELASYIGVSKAAVSKWETGTTYPDITLLPQLATYFNISIDELIGYEPQMTKEQIREAYVKAYQDEYFVRVLDEGVCPETKWVEGSNFVDVNVKVDERTHRVIMMGAMDNITKGAAGQAVQNMNLMFGFDEAEGLRLVPMVP